MKILTKFDYILIVFIFVVAFSINFFVTNAISDDLVNGVVTIYYKNDIYETLSLNEDKVYTIKTDSGINTVEIKNNKVHMLDADCKDKLCLHEHEIEFNNENIVCLPNKIVVKIENSKESELDSIVR